MSDQPVWDKEAAMERVDDDMELFLEIFQIFLEENPRDMETLKNAAAEGNAEQVERRAHAVKSAYGNLGAMRCYELSYVLEKRGREGDHNVAEMISELEKEAQAFIDEIEKQR